METSQKNDNVVIHIIGIPDKFIGIDAAPTSSFMLVCGILTECANDCKFSMCFWIELKSVTLDKIRFCCFSKIR